MRKATENAKTNRRKQMKRTACFLTAFCLTAGLMGGCASNAGSGGSANASGASGQSAGGETGAGGSAEGGANGANQDANGAASLTYWTNMDSSRIAPTTDNYANILCYQEMAKNTGISVEFIHPPIGQEADAFSLLLASGEYPDMIYYDWGNKVSGGADKMIEDGVILRLNELIAENCPNLRGFLDEHPEVEAAMMTDSGNIYCFPNLYPYYTDDPKIICIRGDQIRKDWLKELGLEEPETIEEWHQVLTAFKEKGTNESGEEIIPMVSRKLSTRSSIVRTLANAWDGLDYDFYVQDGVVKFGPMEADFKEYLQTMADWYDEGLIAPEFATYGDKEHDALITSGRAGVWHSGLGAGMGVYISALGDDDSKVGGVRFPVVEKGSTPKFNNASNFPFIGIGVAITSSCKDIDSACKWLDYHYSDEGDMLLNWGVEGVSYELGEDGTPHFTDQVLHDPDGLSVDVAIGKYAMVAQMEAYKQSDEVYAVRMWKWPAQQEASAKWDDTDFNDRYPLTVSMTPEEGAEFAAIMSDIETYRDENAIRYILGTESFDNYDKFVETIKSMNIDRAIEIKQAAYDRLQERLKMVGKE